MMNKKFLICLYLLSTLLFIKCDNATTTPPVTAAPPTTTTATTTATTAAATNAVSSSPDDARRLLGSSYVTRLDSLPMSARSPREPWSGDYNAWRYGGISARFGAQDTRWRPYLQSVGMYTQPADFNRYYRSAGFAGRVASLYSTAEKYDTLMMDRAFTMTNANKRFGLSIGGGRGDVDSWMGMCDGWSMASWMFPAPLHSVKLIAADGRTPVTFSTSDIKNLGSIFWRGAQYDSRMVGRRSGPVNPASWFLIFTNIIGVRKGNVNMEPTADNEIWNYPATGYRVSYANYLTGSGGSWASARVPLRTARASRSMLLRQAAANAPAGTAYLVGVNMLNTYNMEITNSPNNQPNKPGSSNYSMLLHVGPNSEVLGGFWTSKARPSYAWGAAADVNGPYDSGSNDIACNPSQLANMTGKARASSAGMMPLKAVIRCLFRMARS
jgi:hypothetical protein